jgi:hypothetical protein
VNNIVLSRLPHTWLIDVDGTIVKHNGHKDGCDELLPGVKEFWDQIPDQDFVILLSARLREEQADTMEMIRRYGLRFDKALFGMPTGERVLINDVKPGGLKTALALNIERNKGFEGVSISYDPNL